MMNQNLNIKFFRRVVFLFFTSIKTRSGLNCKIYKSENMIQPINFNVEMISEDLTKSSYAKGINQYLWAIILLMILTKCTSKSTEIEKNPPNILLAISDDQSYPHASAYGCKFVHTPHFDRVASDGVLFNRAYAPSPSCSPTRASILTGRNIWQNEEAGVHISLFPKKFQVLPDILATNGYHVGMTGKGWSPGNWRDSGWEHNPAGPGYYQHDTVPPSTRMSKVNYAANFKTFMKERKEGQPFYFWFGGSEPHRGYEYGSGYAAGKRLADLEVPPFLLDDSVTRMDLLDYALEIEYFDQHLGLMLDYLKEIGELENTIVIVTSDNGMPFPRAKINMYDYGIHMPLAVSWNKFVPGDRTVDDFVSLIDLKPTILEAAGVAIPEQVTGRSFLNVIKSDASGQVDNNRSYVSSGKERHNYARADNMNYPIRAIRSDKFLYLRNFKPDRWPSGDPPVYKDSELDKVSGKTIMDKKDTDVKAQKLFQLTVEKRPEEELFNVEIDPGCLNNLADDPAYNEVREKLWQQLKADLEKQSDPRIFGKGDVFDSYPVFNPIIMKDKDGKGLFPGFSELGEYNPEFQD